MRSEDIDYLIRNGIRVTESELRGMGKYDLHRDSIINGLEAGPVPIDRAGIASFYDSVQQSFSDGVGYLSQVVERSDLYTDALTKRITSLNSLIDKLKEETAAASVLERNMMGEINSLLLIFQDREYISDASKNIVINKDRLYAKPDQDRANKEIIRLEEYPISSITASIRTAVSIDPAKVENVNAIGAGYTDREDQLVINTGEPFRISGATRNKQSIKLDLIIDRKDNSMFSQRRIACEKAQMITIYTSDNKDLFEARVAKPTYVHDTSIEIAPTTDRYVKIIFHKVTEDIVSTGQDNISVTLKSLYITKTSFTGQALLVTPSIELKGFHSKVAIGVCDSTSLGLDTMITYYVSVNGAIWNKIRPVSSITNADLLTPSVLNINNASDNRLMLLRDKEKIEGGQWMYDLPLPEDFIRSNDIRLFGRDISVRCEDWTQTRGVKEVSGILYTDKTIDFKDKEVSINGIWMTGKQTLIAGIYSLKVRLSNYSNVILDRSGQVKHLGGGEYSVTGIDGVFRTVYDRLYPYNHKNIIEESFDMLFKKELTLNMEYTKAKKKEGYRIITSKDEGDIFCAYRLYTTNLSSIQVKAVLESKDNISIPFIEKITIRAA